MICSNSSDGISIIHETYEDKSTSNSPLTDPSGTTTPTQSCSGYWGEKPPDCPTKVSIPRGLEDLEDLRLELTRTRTSRHPDAPELNKEADLLEFLVHSQQQDDQFGRHGKKLGVAFKGLSVRGVDMQTSFVKTFGDAVVGSLGPDLWGFIQVWILRRSPVKTGAPLRTLIDNFCGVVRGGEVTQTTFWVKVIVDDDGLGKTGEWM